MWQKQTNKNNTNKKKEARAEKDKSATAKQGGRSSEGHMQRNG